MTRFFLSLAMLFSLACNKVESLDTAENMSPYSPVQISVLTPSTTKGAVVNDPVDMGSVGLYCAMTGSDKWTSETEFSRLQNQRYYISSSNEDWTIDGESVSWGFESLSDKYTFFAYSPYCDDTKGVTPQIDGGELIINYIVPENSLYQPDLMYAMPRKDIFPQSAGRVSLNFYHALSCVSFSVISQIKEKITAINISGVVSSGSLGWDYDLNTPHWELDDLTDSSFSVEVEDYTLDDDYSAQVNTEQGYLMMIPQVLESGAQVVLTLDSGEQKNLTIPSGSEWKAGEKYQYVIRLDDEECDFLFRSNQLSNCYIINPTVGEETVIQIPIEDRINDFWLNYSEDNSEKINEENEPDEFTVTIIWEDFDSPLEYSYVMLDDIDEKMAVRLTIPAEFQEGNLVFAVEGYDKWDTANILWSWHLWFTDYNPDAIASANRDIIEAGVDKEYTLKNYTGAVHRYEDADGADGVWSGIYSDKFIMDRNIGERNEYTTDYGAGSVYYQFGRKEPFPGSYAKYGSGALKQTTRSSSGFSFDQSVDYTRDFFFSTSSSSKNWCEAAAARSALNIWYDENILYSGYSEGKSIFDPSPLGWRVPVNDTWSSFNTTKGMSSITSVGKYNYFGCRDSENGSNLSQSQLMGYVWSANQVDHQTGYCFSYCDTLANSSTEIIVTYGLPIRAIEE